jgi:hypothetical protein
MGLLASKRGTVCKLVPPNVEDETAIKKLSGPEERIEA